MICAFPFLSGDMKMCRMCEMLMVLVGVGILSAAAGCGSPKAKESPKASQPTVQSQAADDAAAVSEDLKDLSPEDRAAALKQRVCPVSGEVLGAMGKPYKITVKGRTVFLCCSGCEEEFRKNPDKYFAKMKKK